MQKLTFLSTFSTLTSAPGTVANKTHFLIKTNKKVISSFIKIK